MGVDGQEEPGGSENADGPPSPRPSGEGRSATPGVPRQRRRKHRRTDAAADAPLTDLQLVARIRAGESDAYEELYRRHALAVRRYARSCCRDNHTADDLTNEVFASTLQAVRGGAGPESSVRAYLLTTVRRVAASWGKSAKREQLVEDFAEFASSAERLPVGAGDDETLGLGADVLAMQEAEHSLAVKAFRSLPPRWQTVLWHTTVEEESPSEVAPLLGLTANATAVLAHRAREGLKQAYLQAHVSSALTAGGDCARFADRLGAYARGGLRLRAERGLRRHLESCARCRTAALEVADVNERLRALLPVAVIGWFAAGFSAKAAAGLAAGAAGAGTAAGAGVAAASGGAAGAGGTGAGASSGAGAGAGASGGSTGGGAGSTAASHGLGAPAKIAVIGGMVAAAGAAAAYALIGLSSAPDRAPQAEAPKTPVAPVATPRPTPAPQRSHSPGPSPTPTPVPSVPTPRAKATVTAQTRTAGAAPVVPVRAALPKPRPKPSPPPAPPVHRPAPSPSPSPTPSPTPSPPPRPPAVYPLNQLAYAGAGDGTRPEVQLGAHSWLWQRYGLRVGGVTYGNGVSVHAPSAVTIELNRPCTAFSALVGVDDMSMGLGAAQFSVYGDGVPLWRSGVVRAGEPAVPVYVPLSGHRTIRLSVQPRRGMGWTAVSDWARSWISCG
ncbi:sigma-70 family RNA polymerase sigma factor [Streptomyces roseoverticillatus]|uniref:Sigma-70 family RNA polymerase sigma factor n=1 Tax=Streptomyces roseoverticillatus TaxID=66429 RepID=A0ABV3IYY6_9ACTN